MFLFHLILLGLSGEKKILLAKKGQMSKEGVHPQQKPHMVMEAAVVKSMDALPQLGPGRTGAGSKQGRGGARIGCTPSLKSGTCARSCQPGSMGG